MCAMSTGRCESLAIFFSPNDPNECCLCGSSEDLSGEHKIKRSMITEEFGKAKMVIGSFGDEATKLRSVQGPKSKELHFEAKICKKCNNERTQKADREFDMLHSIARKILENGGDPAAAMSDGRYALGSESYLNVFRYFAKLLCCHLAQSGGPRPLHMAKFAIGEASQNSVWLTIDKDVTYEALKSSWEGELQYAAHGGLVVYGDKSSGSANGFHSTLTVGPVRYIFFTRLNWLEKLSLRFAHPKFNEWCKEKVKTALESPISDQERDRLGL